MAPWHEPGWHCWLDRQVSPHHRFIFKNLFLCTKPRPSWTCAIKESGSRSWLLAVRKQSSLEDITQPSIVNQEKCVPIRPAPIFGLIAKSVIEYSDERTSRTVEKNWVKRFSAAHAITLRVGTVNRTHNKCLYTRKILRYLFRCNFNLFCN